MAALTWADLPASDLARRPAARRSSCWRRCRPSATGSRALYAAGRRGERRLERDTVRVPLRLPRAARGRRAASSLTPPSTDADRWTGTRSTRAPPRAAAPARRSCHGATFARVIPVPAEFAGHAEPALVAVRGCAPSTSATSGADATDLARIVVARVRAALQQRLVHDPLPAAGGQLAEMQGIVVDRRVRLADARRADDRSGRTAWTGWDVFSLAAPPVRPAPTPLAQHLFLPPALPTSLRASRSSRWHSSATRWPIMVWAIERADPGRARRRARTAPRPLAASRRRSTPPRAPPPGGRREWRSGHAPVHSADRSRRELDPLHPRAPARAITAIQLQRAPMRRFDRARCGRSGRRRRSCVLDSTTTTAAGPYFVHEEEVPRAGVSDPGACCAALARRHPSSGTAGGGAPAAARAAAGCASTVRRGPIAGSNSRS